MRDSERINLHMDRVYLEKFEFVRHLLQRESVNYRNLRSLDLGCRNMELQKVLGIEDYTGVDFNTSIKGKANGLFHNLEEPLPFKDGEFEIVYALDILEHLENLHRCLSEIRRIASRYILIGLPNMYHYVYRLKFLLGRPLGTKYYLSRDAVLDRHRWIFTFNEAMTLIYKEFDACKEVTIWGHRVPYKYLSLRLIDSLVSSPKLGGYTIFFLVNTA